MAKIEDDEIDLCMDAENVSFLVNCFDNSFAIQSSLNYVKDYVAQTDNEDSASKNVPSLNKKNSIPLASKPRSLNGSINNNDILSQLQENTQTFKKKLSNWGLPSNITTKYEQKGITEMFKWQVQCLGNSKVLLDSCNLVYSAPTSAGKTLVAEILTIKTILERQKKVIIILPFVSIVREKMFYLQDILSGSGIRVEGFMGSQSPPGGLQAVHLAICTIEKANSLLNKLIDEGNISELGAVIVDELHLLGDPHRGYILELLLTKIKYLSSKLEDINIQIVGMSATLPNLEILSSWLEAELFVTDFRPIPLDEYCLVANKYYDTTGNYVSTLKKSKEDLFEGDSILNLCLETIKEGCSVLIFCMTKNRCESLAQSIATSFYKLGCSKSSDGILLRDQLNSKKISEVLEQLQNCPVGLDQVLKNIISFGVAYHHAGLTFDERDIIEGAFKSGAVRVLIATSTLSSGVNLPARKVIIRSPVFQRQPINILTYKQMVGRAGRMGKDTKGESILMCTQAEQKIGFDLMMGNLEPVKSCIDCEDKFMRAVLEMIASQAVCSEYELELYSKCTLLYAQQENSSQDKLLENTLKQLINFELVRVQIDDNDTNYVATSLGKACLASSMAPNDGLSLFCELQKARQCIVLENDLHLIYLVTPYSVSNQWNNIDWLHLLTLWESLPSAMKRVGELVGVQESFIICSLRGVNKSSNSLNKLNIHKRFYTALALQDLVNEKPLSEVAHKFQCARGFLQGLQQSSATFAGMVTAFCHQLGWKNMEMLISQFQDRLHFGIHSDLLELMKLTSLNGVRARTLFNAGFETIASIASANVNVIENTLHKSAPFQSEKEREGDYDADVRKRNKMKNIWITGCCGMTAKEAAERLILEARNYIQLEIGVTDIKWENSENNIKENGHESNGFQVKIVQNSEKEQENLKKPETTSKINMFPSEIKTQSPHIYTTKEDLNHIKLQNPSENIHLQVASKDIQIKLKANNLDDNYNKQDTCKIKTVPLSEKDCNTNTISSKEELMLIKLQPNDLGDNFSKCDTCELKKVLLSEKDCNTNTTSSKEELMWDSLVLSETVLGNITRSRTSITTLSPNISFEGSEYSPYAVNEAIKTNSSIKDVSLFSSEDNDSSLFEESLQMDSISDGMSNNKEENINTSDRDISTEAINSDTILNAFKSSIIDIDEDEDIKLVYEDEYKIPEIVTVPANNIYANKTNNNVAQESPMKNNFKSPLKRHADTYRASELSNKKIRHMNFAKNYIDNINIMVKCSQSDKFTLKLEKNEINCFVLKGKDILDNLAIIEESKEVALLLDIDFEHKSKSDLIGGMVCKGNKFSLKNKVQGDTKEIVKGVTICVSYNVCVFYDLSSLDNILSTIKSTLKRIVTDKSFTLKLHSTKSYTLNLKKWLNEDLLSRCIDISLTEWLLDSDENISNIYDLTKKFCDIDIPNAEILVNNKSFKHKSLDVIERSCLKAWCVWSVADKQKPLLEKYSFIEKISDIETHISKILAKCEFYGIRVDKNLASQLLIDVKNSQEILQKKAFKICGYHFNFNSTKDVAKVLGLYKGRKISTKKSVLTAHNSPMASIVIYWRKLNSILTKTMYPLTEQASIYSADNRISPAYTMYTSTGRISMHEPNLQNVPRTFSIPLKYLTIMESESNDDVIEFNCRNIFKAAPGYIFVSADYCQLEMRILSHYSRDVVLTKIMCSDADVFKSIAASWSGVPEDQVDEDLRQKAKQLCYGILYGMGNRSLSQHLDVTEMEAAIFMDTFYNTYPAIKVFTRTVVEDCRKNGHIETLMRRRRYLPDINSTVGSKRSSAERQAINTTIQGSAADIAKAAMCAIDTRTFDDDHPPRLVLQMHDELIYEVPESKKCTFPLILKEVMENTVQLNVPLPVKVRSGASWGSLEEMKF